MRPELCRYKAIAEAIGILLSPYAEIVIHDFATGSIAFIFNSFSKRRAGDESLLGDIEELKEKELISPYFKVNWDGRKMKSISSLLKNEQGKEVGLLCINLDISQWEQMHRLVLDFIGLAGKQPASLFRDDWREKINVYVTTYLKEKGLHLESLKQEEKKKLLQELWEEGAFDTKNGASYVAEVLRISRATVYNYLRK